MIIESLASSMIVGKIRKGKIKNIEKVELKAWYLFLAALAIEVIPNILENSFKSFFNSSFIYLHTFSYILLFIAIGINCKKKSMWFVLAGTIMNFIVIMVNGGHMPVWIDGLKIAGIVGKDVVQVPIDLTHSVITESTRLKFLADIIPVPKPYPLPKLMSFGDVLLSLGVFIFIQEAMLIKNETETVLESKS